MEGWLSLQVELAEPSTQSSHRVVPGATHTALIEDKAYAVAAVRGATSTVR